MASSGCSIAFAPQRWHSTAGAAISEREQGRSARAIRQLTAYALAEPTVAITWLSRLASVGLRLKMPASTHHDDDVLLDVEGPGVESPSYAKCTKDSRRHRLGPEAAEGIDEKLDD